VYSEAIPHLFDQSLSREVVPNFEQFVRASGALKWFLATDYVVGDATRDLDTFAFSFIPYDDTIENLLAEIDTASKRDIKKIKSVNAGMLDLLRSKRRFHVILVADRSRRWPDSVTGARDAIDVTLAQMQNWQDAARQGATIKLVKALRQEASANSFNYRLFGDIVLLSAVTGYFAAMLVRTLPVEGVVWASDRDKMTTAYGKIAPSFANVNFNAICRRWGIEDDRIAAAKFGFALEPVESQPMWFDPLVRIPDFLAGTVAAWNIDADRIIADHSKFVEVLRGSIANNENVEILRLRTASDELSLRRLKVTLPDVADAAGKGRGAGEHEGER
jgi:hypothetical protein